MQCNIPLEGRVAVVTGGSRGIGRAVVLELAECGADIAVIYAGNEAEAENTVKQAREFDVKAESYRCDVSDFSACGEIAGRVISDFGKADILVNNAGITRDSLLMSMTEEAFSDVVDVNLGGAFNMMKHFSRHFIRNRYGRIINISSVVAIIGNPGQANYCASKAGLIGLTRSASIELAARGITCNAVAPGYIETDMTAALPEQAREKLLSAVPAGRAGTPEDVARLVSFLASDGASYINGEVIRVDGAMRG